MTPEQIKKLEFLITANTEPFEEGLDSITKELDDLTGKMRDVSKEMKKSLGGATDATKKVGEGAKEMGKGVEEGAGMSGLAFTKMGALAVAGGVLIAKTIEKVLGLIKKGIDALKRFIKESVKFAIDAIETESLVAGVFKGGTEEITRWSNELSDALGLNAYQLRQDASVIMSVAKAMGIVGDNAMTMSKGIVEMGRDLSTRFAMSVEDANRMITKGLTGHVLALQTLREMGVVLDDTVIRETAYAEGIAQTGERLSKTQEGMARYVAMTKQLYEVQGEFTRRMESPAMQLKIMRERIREVSANFGSLFIPVLNAVFPYLQALITLLQKATDALMKFFGVVGIQAVGAVEGLASGFTDFNEGLGGAAKGVGKLKKELLGLAGFDEMNVLTQPDASAGGGGAGVGGFGDANGYQLPDYSMLAEGFVNKGKELAEKLIQQIKDAWQKVKDFLGLDDVFENLKEYWNNEVKPMFDGLKAQWAEIKELFKSTGLDEFFGDFFGMLGKIAGFILQTLIGLIMGLIQIVLALLSAVLFFVKHAILNFDKFMDAIAWLINSFVNLWDKAKEVGQKIWDWYKDVFDAFVFLIKDAIAKGIKYVQDIQMAIGKFILNAILKFLEFKARVEWVWEMLKSYVAYRIALIRNDIYNRIENIKNLFVGIWDTAKWVFSSIANWIWSKIDWAVDKVKSLMGGLKGTFLGIFDNIATGLSSSFNAVISNLRWMVNRYMVTPLNNARSIINQIPGVNIGRIPELARGGIVGKPTLAMLGESGKEAVVPLENNTEWIDKLASKIGGNGEIHLTVQVGDEKIAERVIDYANDKATRTGNLIFNV